MNPFTEVSKLYSAEMRERYRRGACEDDAPPLAPHVYEAAARAYASMCRGRSQSVIINGESGAGKTETTKILLTYLTSAAEGQGSRLVSQIVASSPSLEAFGNAKVRRWLSIP
jgi:myosin-5